MKGYAVHGFNEFVVALGYKGDAIKNYFLDYQRTNGSISVELKTGEVSFHESDTEDWKVDLLDTGVSALTKSRVDQIIRHTGNETTMLTYGDGVADIDISKLLEFHRAHGKIATMTIVRPPARFGAVELDGDAVASFQEKPQIGEGWINGGFFVLEPEIADYVSGAEDMWERGPLEQLATNGELMAYKHAGFWQPMDTPRDKVILEDLWRAGDAPWKTWK
jgi:glucose-1-phosphate cytidylyltransferase